jgi:orotidine-5'-phosphate decarboxylase
MPETASATATATQPASHPRDRVFAAIDTPDVARAARLVESLRGEVGGVKIGNELFTAQGPDGVRAVAGGERLFLDLKFHDIHNTVAGAVRSATRLRPFCMTLHASGGRAMMEAAAEAAREAAEELEVARPKLLGVTVLTSLDADDLAAVGQPGPVADQVRRLAGLAQDAGLDGVVCSPREIAVLRADRGPGFILLVPGIRPDWAASGDQKRVTTPGEAIAAGADYLVIGRPITAQADPRAAARRIAEELAAAQLTDPAEPGP